MAYLWNQTESDRLRDVGHGYYNQPRFDLFKAIGNPGNKMLDVGCASGATSKELKNLYPQTKFYGVEPSKQLSKIARENCDEFFNVDFETYFQTYGYSHQKSFSTILFADILEHTYNPWKILKDSSNLLVEGGRIVISIPNIFNLDTLHDLASGNWNYQKYGIMDFTHIRFFTRSSIKKMLLETGYTPIAAYGTKLKSKLVSSCMLGDSSIQIGNLILNNISIEKKSELFISQFVITAVYKTV